MRYLLLGFLWLNLSCQAEEPILEANNFNGEYENQTEDSMHSFHMDFSPGFTVATLDSYHVKFTAEQRYSDKLVQIVLLPEEQGVHFHVHNVQFGRAPAFFPGNETVAKIHGNFSIESSNWRRGGLRKMIPIQVMPVNQFSIGADEARIQGKTCIQRDLPNMLTD